MKGWFFDENVQKTCKHSCSCNGTYIFSCVYICRRCSRSRLRSGRCRSVRTQPADKSAEWCNPARLQLVLQHNQRQPARYQRSRLQHCSDFTCSAAEGLRRIYHGCKRMVEALSACKPPDCSEILVRHKGRPHGSLCGS